MKSSSSELNWKKFQLKFLQADDIACDYVLKQKIISNPTWKYNLDFASTDIKLFACENNIAVSNVDFDFFIITDLEFGKLPLKHLESTVFELYERSRHGGYLAVVSYYLNWNNDPDCCYNELDDNMDVAIEQWLKDVVKISNFKNISLPISNALSNRLPSGELITGSNFIYTHGDIRFWLCK